MEVLSGIGVSNGIARANAFVLPYVPIQTIPRHVIEESSIIRECSRLDVAVQAAIQEIELIQLRNTVSKHEIEILSVHIEMLKDVSLIANVKQRLSELKQNIESVVYDYMEELGRQFADSGDPYLRERDVDIFDVSKRILEQLLYQKRTEISLDAPSILICHMLTPMDFISIDKRYLKGIVIETSGKNSHTMILARSLGIPCVGGITDACVRVRRGVELIVDGKAGTAIVSPDTETKDYYALRLEEYLLERKKQRTNVVLPCETKDGLPISLLANIEFPEEAAIAKQLGAQGIGLYRSEYLFLQKTWPTEEEQYQAYLEATKAFESSTVIIRTLDIGGDKLSPGVREENPMLGWRAVRFSLSHRRKFTTQIHALLRVACIRKVDILIPMISSLEEILLVKEIINDQVAALNEEGHSPEFSLGIMVEVPSTVYILPTLASHVDFLSLGTNDLIQYIMAADRGNEFVSNLYSPFYPGVLLAIKQVFNVAQEYTIPISLCGEMAGDPMAIPLLIGMGLRKFSVSLDQLPQTRAIIRNTMARDTIALRGELFGLTMKEDIEDLLRGFISEYKLI